MSRSYEFVSDQWRQGTDGDALLMATCLTVGVWGGWTAVPPVLAAAALLVSVRRRWVVAVGCVGLVLVGVTDGHHAWSHAVPRRLGPYTGAALVAADPVTVRGGVRVTLKIQGERFDSFLAGGRFGVLTGAAAGDVALVEGTRTPLASNRRRSQERHVVGRFRIVAVTDVVPGDAAARAGNRVRVTVQRAGEVSMAPESAALFSGLVLGDDGREPSWLVDAFRSSGLSHLTAVSGQNVAYLLAAAGPLLRRLRPWPRWAATVALIAWFMALTRFEPSVLRAGVMAMLSATGFLLGRRASPVRLVAWAVLVLVALDPMLVWTVGFWLSVGAALGVSALAPRIAERLHGPPWWRAAVSVTLGAQAGVALPSLLVFHRLPVVSVPANLVAVPVAGLVMLYGLPAGIAGGVLPVAIARVVMSPAALGTRWVATVARLAARLEPGSRWDIVGWAFVVVVLVLTSRPHSRAGPADVPF